MRTLYIVKTGCTFAHIAQTMGDFDDWIRKGLEATGSKPLPCEVLPAHADTAGALNYPGLQQCAGVVITGSHAMVTEAAAWMQPLQQWLHQVCHAGIPVLGICFGHQLLAQTLGGQVAHHPQGLELGTVPVSVQADVSNDPLWHTLPSDFEVQAVHYQTVRQLPKDAMVLAGNAHEPHHAFRWRSNVWGVQFHPEFSEAAMQAYIDHVQQERMVAAPPSLPARRRTYCAPTPQSASLLVNFARHARQHALQG